jgi:hypothetical protein
VTTVKPHSQWQHTIVRWRLPPVPRVSPSRVHEADHPRILVEGGVRLPSGNSNR